MKCSEADRWISLLVDGEPLPAGSAHSVHEHVSECSSCRELLRLEKSRASLLSGALGAEGSDESRLAAAIAGEFFTSEGPSGEHSREHRAAAVRPWKLLVRRLPPLAWTAAALLVFSVTGSGFWWGGSFLRPGARNVEIARPGGPAAPMEPASPAKQEFSPAAESPFQLRYVEDSWEMMPVGDQGVPMGRKVHRTRSRVFDLPIKNQDAGGPQPPRSWMLEVERVDTRYYQLKSWPYE